MTRKIAILCLFALAGAGCAHNPYPSETKPEDAKWTPGQEVRSPAALSATTMMNRAMQAKRRDDVAFDANRLNVSKDLANCHGSAFLKRDAGTLKLVVTIPRNGQCSNVLAYNPKNNAYEKIGKFPDGEGRFEVSLNESFGSNAFSVWLSSESGITAAKVSVNSFVPYPKRNKLQIDPLTPADYTLSTYMFGRRWGELSSCGGNVYMSIEDGDVYLDFYGVKQCSIFDVLTDNGQVSTFTNQNILDGQRVKIPRDFYDRGFNTIKVLLKSQSGITYDIFRIEFPAI